MDESLREELLAMVAEDHCVRAKLVAEGTLYDGYHPRMQAVHERNARRLVEIIERPGRTLVGEDGARRDSGVAAGVPRGTHPIFRGPAATLRDAVRP